MRRVKTHLHDPEKCPGYSSSPQSKYCAKGTPKAQSKKEAIPETEGLQKRKRSGQEPLFQKESDHANHVDIAQSRTRDVGIAGRGPSNVHTDDKPTRWRWPRRWPRLHRRRSLTQSNNFTAGVSPRNRQSVVGDESRGDGAVKIRDILDSDDMHSLSSVASSSDDESTSTNMSHSSVSSTCGSDSPPEPTSISGDYSFTAGTNIQKRDPHWSHLSHTVESFEEPIGPKKPRKTITATRSRAASGEHTEQPRAEMRALQEWCGEVEETIKCTEAAPAQAHKTNPESDQALPMLIPRASPVPDQQTDAQELKDEVSHRALYTLSRNANHWTSSWISRWLVQTHYCSHSTLIEFCNRVRGCRRISWTCVSRNSRHGRKPFAISPCFHEG